MLVSFSKPSSSSLFCSSRLTLLPCKPTSKLTWTNIYIYITHPSTHLIETLVELGKSFFISSSPRLTNLIFIAIQTSNLLFQILSKHLLITFNRLFLKNFINHYVNQNFPSLSLNSNGGTPIHFNSNKESKVNKR